MQICFGLCLVSFHLEEPWDDCASISVRWKGDGDLSIGEHRHQETFRGCGGKTGGLGDSECEARRARNPRGFERPAGRADARCPERATAQVGAGDIRSYRAGATQPTERLGQAATGQDSTDGTDSEPAVQRGKDSARTEAG